MRYIYILSLLVLGVGCFKEKTKAKTLEATVVTEIKIKDSVELINVGKMQLFSDEPNVKDCFLAINEAFLPIPAAYRIQMLEDYDIRDVLQQSQQLAGDKQAITYNYEIDNLDSLKDYMMFSVFNDYREINYFLRYFRDSTENEAHAIGLSRIEKWNNRKEGKYVFLAQIADTLAVIDSLFPNVTMRDFMDEKHFASLNLSESEINQPNILVWLPSRRQKSASTVGVELCLDMVKKATEVKSLCRRTQFDVKWGAGVFAKDGLKPIIPKIRKQLAKNWKGRHYKGGKSSTNMNRTRKSKSIAAKKVIKKR
jgi:hypothetical protein